MSSNHNSSVARELRDDLAQEDRRAVSRAKLWIGLQLFLVIFAIGYMTWINRSVSKLNAEELTRIAASTVEQRIPQIRADLRDYALELAPELTAQAGELFENLPSQLADYLEAELLTKSNEAIVRLEGSIDLAVSTVIEDQLELIQSSIEDGTAEDQLDAIVLGVSDAFRETMIEALDELYIEYAQQVRELNAHLDHLLRDEGLSESEKVDKRLIETWMVLVQKHEITEQLVANLQRDY